MPGPLVQQSLIVSRNQPLPIQEGQNPGAGPRAGRYGEQVALSLIPTKHLLADEGAYMIASMAPGATGLQLGLSAAFSALAAAIVIQNTDSPSNPNAKRIYLDQIHAIVSGAPTSATDLQYATVLDSVNRAPTTVALPAAPATATAYKQAAACVNMDVTPQIVGQAYFPLSTAAGAPPAVPAAGPNARTIVGNGNLRSQIPVVKDDIRIVFGSLDPTSALNTAAPAGASRIVEPHPPVVIGPGQSFLLYLWMTANATAGIIFNGLDASWWER
jgi:hypothetical protein